MFEVSMPIVLRSGQVIPVVSVHPAGRWDGKKFREWATNYVRRENEDRPKLGLGRRYLAWIRDKRTGRFV